ncbi:MAG: malto-oligosyltrehalose trehalohydrolase [Proteobacteria bacterium]|nr:malto-oligosyltrehalose trehalohydrolase [Pseudomonadota bacterium]
MQKRPSGWFERLSDEARASSRYRFRLDHGETVPDPASRFNPEDVHGPSVVVDPGTFAWQDHDWRGRPWEDAVVYELHVGTFTPEGTFRAILERLDYLVELGVTAIELMPVADFPGRWGWGYDGVLLFAPDASYGTPDDLKELVQTAHLKGLMVFLDVVYNHFGPEGNYLYVYAKPFFSERHVTPWGSAINFDAEGSEVVRAFFIHNALFWLGEYHFDGLRLDAVHAIADDSTPDILEALAARVREFFSGDRHIHLVLENDANAARYLAREPDGTARCYRAQWNDDLHHALHCLLTGETEGYYADYADRPLEHLGRALSEGFAYQGEPSRYREGRVRGEASRDLPPIAFVNFLQTHDQVGNRAFGERLGLLTSDRALAAATTLLLLSPAPPLLFMGEEFRCAQPFLYFCDFGPDLAQAVTEGRRQEFSRFEAFADPKARLSIPDPCDASTFIDSKIDWRVLDEPLHAQWLAFCRGLLALRHEVIVPLLPGIRGGESRYRLLDDHGLEVSWRIGTGDRLTLLCNFAEVSLSGLRHPPGTLFCASDPAVEGDLDKGELPAWSTAWFLESTGPGR